MSRQDVIVWEVIGEAFWLVALVTALLFGLFQQSHPTISTVDQPVRAGIMQVLPDYILETWNPAV